VKTLDVFVVSHNSKFPINFLGASKWP